MRRIKHPEEIFELSLLGKSVMFKPSGKPIPAAFVVNFQLHLVIQMIKAKNLYYYQPKNKKNVSI